MSMTRISPRFGNRVTNSCQRRARMRPLTDRRVYGFASASEMSRGDISMRDQRRDALRSFGRSAREAAQGPSCGLVPAFAVRPLPIYVKGLLPLDPLGPARTRTTFD